jgi:hypothetical protein
MFDKMKKKFGFVKIESYLCSPFRKGIAPQNA